WDTKSFCSIWPASWRLPSEAQVRSPSINGFRTAGFQGKPGLSRCATIHNCHAVAPAMETIMPKLNGILETAIHTEDMARSREFYVDVLGLELMYSDARLSAYAVTGRDVLLVFRKGETAQTVTLPSGTIPGHGGSGPLHVAFA